MPFGIDTEWLSSWTSIIFPGNQPSSADTGVPPTSELRIARVPAMIRLTASRPPVMLSSNICTDHPCISMYRIIKGSNDPWYFEEFQMEDGQKLSRMELCWAILCAYQIVMFYHSITIPVEWSKKKLPEKYQKQMEVVTALSQGVIKCLDELQAAMQNLSIWENTHYLPPPSWDPIGTYNLGNLSHASNRLELLPKQSSSTMSPLFIPVARHLLKIREEGIAAEWWELRDLIKPDPNAFAFLEPPEGFPMSQWDSVPRKRNVDGTVEDGTPPKITPYWEARIRERMSKPKPKLKGKPTAIAYHPPTHIGILSTAVTATPEKKDE